jgi:hypothetical protein
MPFWRGLHSSPFKQPASKQLPGVHCGCATPPPVRSIAHGESGAQVLTALATPPVHWQIAARLFEQPSWAFEQSKSAQGFGLGAGHECGVLT